MSTQTRALISVVPALFFLAGVVGYLTQGYSHAFQVWVQWALAMGSAVAWAASAIFSMELSSGTITSQRAISYSNYSMIANFWAALLTGVLAMIFLFYN